MSESYQIVPPPGSSAPLDPKRIADLLAKDGQLILPLLDLLENAQCALDDLIDVMGRATIEAVLRMSAEAIAGPRQRGQKSDRDIVYHGTQKGRVALKEREIVVDKPRLRRRHPQEGESAEVEVPAYEAMRGDTAVPAGGGCAPGMPKWPPPNPYLFDRTVTVFSHSFRVRKRHRGLYLRLVVDTARGWLAAYLNGRALNRWPCKLVNDSPPSDHRAAGGSPGHSAP